LFFVLQTFFVQEAFAYCPGFLSKDMYFMSEDSDVKKLQIFLNSKPETQISSSGIGSPGYETGRYAYATQDAVKRFQTLNGLPVTGAVGLSDRLFINLFCQGDVSEQIIQTPEVVTSISTPTSFTISTSSSAVYSLSVATLTVDNLTAIQDGLIVPVSTTSGPKDYMVMYKVSTGKTLDFYDGYDAPEYRNLYNSIKSLIPTDVSDKYISYFKVSYSTQPGKKLLAMVTPYDRESDKFVLTIFYNNFMQEPIQDRNLTIIHEMAHLLSLNKSWQIATDTCTTFSDMNHFCYDTYSPINQFYKSFWEGVSVKPSYNNSQFVNEYATTNPLEDFAETFTYYVGKDIYNLQNFFPTPDSVVGKKLNFFNYFSDFYNLKNHFLNLLK
jgi:hypothetical protein